MSQGSEQGGRKDPFGDGLRQGLGVLSAFKEALEETIQEAKQRGDLSTDRARDVMKDALDRAQVMAGEARERLDFVSRKEFEGLTARVAALEGTATGSAAAAEAESTEAGQE